MELPFTKYKNMHQFCLLVLNSITNMSKNFIHRIAKNIFKNYPSLDDDALRHSIGADFASENFFNMKNLLIYDNKVIYK